MVGPTKGTRQIYPSRRFGRSGIEIHPLGCGQRDDGSPLMSSEGREAWPRPHSHRRPDGMIPTIFLVAVTQQQCRQQGAEPASAPSQAGGKYASTARGRPRPGGCVAVVGMDAGPAERAGTVSLRLFTPGPICRSRRRRLQRVGPPHRDVSPIEGRGPGR